MKLKQRKVELRYGKEKSGVLTTWVDYLIAVSETRTIQELFH